MRPWRTPSRNRKSKLDNLSLALVPWLVRKVFCSRPSPSYVWLNAMSAIAQWRYPSSATAQGRSPSSALAQWRSPSSGCCFNIHQLFSWNLILYDFFCACCRSLMPAALYLWRLACVRVWQLGVMSVAFLFSVCSYGCCLSAPSSPSRLSFPALSQIPTEWTDNMHSHRKQTNL